MNRRSFLLAALAAPFAPKLADGLTFLPANGPVPLLFPPQMSHTLHPETWVTIPARFQDEIMRIVAVEGNRITVIRGQKG